ncbi:MAG: hypothetical protein Q8M07_31285 [Prosthecobacter sp.]|nr:hypothetical protein [Prosthecobacter sp.]
MDSKSQGFASGLAHRAIVCQCLFGITSTGLPAWRADTHRMNGQRTCLHGEGGPGGIDVREQPQKLKQVMGFWDEYARLVDCCFEAFFRALLAVKADLIVKRHLFSLASPVPRWPRSSV